MSWFPPRWRTRQDALRDANCRIQWIINSSNATGTEAGFDRFSGLSLSEANIYLFNASAQRASNGPLWSCAFRHCLGHRPERADLIRSCGGVWASFRHRTKCRLKDTREEYLNAYWMKHDEMTCVDSEPILLVSGGGRPLFTRVCFFLGDSNRWERYFPLTLLEAWVDETETEVFRGSRCHPFCVIDSRWCVSS